MHVGAADGAAAKTGIVEPFARRIRDGEQPVRLAFMHDRRIMEFMRGHRRGEAGACQRRDAAIAEMASAFGEAGDERQEAEHAVPCPIRRNESLPQDHIASAFAIDARAALCRLLHALAETAGIGKPRRMKLRIAARQIDGIGVRRRRLVGERREEGQARPLCPPARKQVLIAESESLVAGDGDPLPERRQAGRRRREGLRSTVRIGVKTT